MKIPSKAQKDEWNAQRDKIEKEFIALAESLMDHLGSCNVRSDYEVELGGGRVLRVTVSASRVRSH